MKIKLFYSYSHSNETDRNQLENHLTTLNKNGLIDEWHDRKICAGEDWGEEINREMENAHIILLLFSADFIASDACQKEIKKTLELKRQKKLIFIPIILKECAWQDVEGMSGIQALPKEAKAVSLWDDKDAAWNNVYEEIKKTVENFRKEITPILKDDWKGKLLENPTTGRTLDRLFVFPDILEANKPEQKLESNEISSEKLKDIEKFKHKYILIEGDEQSGKTSLCNILYLHYAEIGIYPILVNGEKITGKADIENLVNKAYQEQYDSTIEYWAIEKENRILIIDDINNRNAKDKNFSSFLQSIEEKFKYAIVSIDKLSKLSKLSSKSTNHDYFYLFNDYSIKQLGHTKRDELIKKCIANDENTEFKTEDKEQVAKLDKDTKHINTIIGSNIVPSYPFFIIATFNIIESSMHHDMKETSYGYCYTSMITTQLRRTNIPAGDIDKYFNFLTEFSYFMFNKNKKSVSKNELDNFIKIYKNEYIFDGNIVDNLIKSKILLVTGNDKYSFPYIYIYYYFVAKYLAEHVNEKDIKNTVECLLSSVHKKDNSNIIVFITHHTKKKILLDSILSNALKHFKRFPEATLKKEETEFIGEYIERLGNITIAPDDHDPEQTRDEILKKKDSLKPAVDKLENEAENTEEDLLFIEIRKSAKSMEIIGQIMKNQYGTFKKDRLSQLFLEGQNTGLRLLSCFISFMDDNKNDMENLFQQRLEQITKKNVDELSKKEIKSLSRQFVTEFSYMVVFGWIHKIVDSLGFDKLIEISDKVNKETNTTASKLINFSIHAWHKKNIDIATLKQLYSCFTQEKNHTAIYILRDIVSRHIYMHKLGFKEKQQINTLLGFDVKKQLSIQSKLK